MRNPAYLILVLSALVVPSAALATIGEMDPEGAGGDSAGAEGAASEGGEGAGGDDRSWTLDASEGGGCSLAGVPPAGRKAALTLLGLAFVSFGIRLAPRRRRARVAARR